jgi:uncharacterized protein (TIGR02266 family)
MKNYAVNLSTGGMFIESNKILPVETLLTVEFMLPNANRQIACKARVAWTNEPEALKKPSLPPGMGIQFLNLSLENIQLIRNFVTEYELQPVW